MRFLGAGVLAAPKGAALETRLAAIARGLREVLAEWRPHEAAVEDVFVKADPRAALAVGHGRGALLAVLGEHGLTVAGHAPARVKRALTGNGRAAKTQVAAMVRSVLGMAESPPGDATDALAVAVAHVLSRRTQLPAG